MRRWLWRNGRSASGANPVAVPLRPLRRRRASQLAAVPEIRSVGFTGMQAEKLRHRPRRHAEAFFEIGEPARYIAREYATPVEHDRLDAHAHSLAAAVRPSVIPPAILSWRGPSSPMGARTCFEAASPSTTRPGHGDGGGRSGRRSSIWPARSKAVQTRVSRRVDGDGASAHTKSSPPSSPSIAVRSERTELPIGVRCRHAHAPHKAPGASRSSTSSESLRMTGGAPPMMRRSSHSTSPSASPSTSTDSG